MKDDLPKIAVVGAANGVLFMTFFGTLWASIGIVGAHGLWSPWLIVVSALISILLLTAAITLFKKARTLRSSITTEERDHWKKVNQKFGLVFFLEGAAIAIASFICNYFHHFELFFPIMAIIVGIHFFPLAQLFRVSFYHITGAVLCMLGVVTFFLPMNAVFQGNSIIFSSVFIGFGAALTLWLTGFAIWITTRIK